MNSYHFLQNHDAARFQSQEQRGWGLALTLGLEKRFDEHSVLSGPVVFRTVNRTCKGHGFLGDVTC